MKKVLITGALGQNGQILSSIYKNKNLKVFGFIKKQKKNKLKKVNYFINNLKNKNKIEKHLKKIDPDIIVHLASVNNSYTKRLERDSYKINYLNNLNITKNLINAIVKIKVRPKFIFAGSSLMFGNPEKKITAPNIEKFDRFKYHKTGLCWGASLKAIISLMSEKGYSFIGSNRLNCNAFFIDKDLSSNLNINFPNIESLSDFTDIKFKVLKNQRYKYASLDDVKDEINDLEVFNIENQKIEKFVS